MNNLMYDSYGHYQHHDSYLQRGGPTYGKPMEPPQQHAFKQQHRAPAIGYPSGGQENDYHRSTTAVVAAPSPAGSIFPRSASEAMFDSTSKFRQLPCRTFISVGTCPYRERCVYLHDPRCICKDAKTKTRRKNKEDVVLDALFWPVMPYQMVAGKLDANRQPHVIQSYSVPLPQMDQYRRHDVCVYSMWMHFVDFCLATTESLGPSAAYRNANDLPCYAAPDVAVNAYNEQERLKIFQFLSSRNGRATNKEEVMRITAMPIAPNSFVSMHLQNHPLQVQQQSYSRYNAAIAASSSHQQPQGPAANYPGYLPIHHQQQGGVYGAYGAANGGSEAATNPYFHTSEPSLDEILGMRGNKNTIAGNNHKPTANFLDPLANVNNYATPVQHGMGVPRAQQPHTSPHMGMPKPLHIGNNSHYNNIHGNEGDHSILDAEVAFYKSNGLAEGPNGNTLKPASPVTVATNDPRSPSHDYLLVRKNDVLKPATSLSMMMNSAPANSGHFDIFREHNKLAVDSEESADPWLSHHTAVASAAAVTAAKEYALSGLLDDSHLQQQEESPSKGMLSMQNGAFNKDPLHLRSNYINSAQTSTESAFSIF